MLRKLSALLLFIAIYFVTACTDGGTTPSVTVKYTVTFYTEEGGEPYYQEVLDSSPYVIENFPAAPVKTGYTFGGWFSGVDGAGSEVTADTVITGSMDLHAHWLADSGLEASISMTTPGNVTLQNNAEVPKGQTISFEVAEQGFTSYRWFLNSTELSETTRQISLDTSSLTPGRHSVMVVVQDAQGISASASSYFSVTN